MSWLATFALVIPDPVETENLSLWSWKNTEFYTGRAWKCFSYVNESQFPTPARSIYHVLFLLLLLIFALLTFGLVSLYLIITRNG